MHVEIQEQLVQAMCELEEEEVLRLAEELLASGVEPLKVIELCRDGFEIVGQRYERREYFLSSLILSDEIFKGVMELIDRSWPLPPERESEFGKVLLGAPLGDVHDIGKGIVSTLLRYSGFEVVDLGVSVKPSEFLDAAVETGAGVVGISALLTMDFEQKGLREKVKIMLGGGAVSQRVCEFAGADAWSRDASDAVKFAKMFMGKE
jgi:methanogenic corrinoid protein MtbC1